MSVANNLDLLSSPSSGCQSLTSWSRRSRSHHSHNRHNSVSESDRDMEDGDDGSHHSFRHNRIEELVDSPPRSLVGIAGLGQGGQAERRLPSPPVLEDRVLKGPEGQVALKPHNSIEGIVNSKKV